MQDFRKSIGFDTEYNLIRGESKQLLLSDKLGNAGTYTNFAVGSITDYNCGRIYISSAETGDYVIKLWMK